ncbi:hypothetical protein [Dictyobacter alpinus]|uniref:hypothetical protein n=1 Tax=Dictyobacter alpinus TaxID=2014873 RepID=UPI000F81F6B8|nr:hypothetical protein [Dictyobacter alpinus]
MEYSDAGADRVDAREPLDETGVFQLVRGGISIIVVHGPGSFTQLSRNVMSILAWMSLPPVAMFVAGRLMTPWCGSVCWR